MPRSAPRTASLLAALLDTLGRHYGFFLGPLPASRRPGLYGWKTPDALYLVIGHRELVIDRNTRRTKARLAPLIP